MSKTTLRLIIILIVLWGAAYIYKGPMNNQGSSGNNPTNLLVDVNTETISEIQVNRDGVITILKKEGNKFKIDGTKNFYVNEETSEKILEGIENAKLATLELISSEEDKKTEFGTAENGISVSFIDESGEAVNVIVGKLANNFIDTYISLPQTPDTYSIGENLVKLFDRDDWKDKTMFKNNSSKVTKVRLQYPNTQYVMEKINDKWEVVEPSKFNVNQSAIEEIVKVMTDLKAVQIPAQTFEGTGLEKHTLIVQVTGEEIDNTIMVGDQKPLLDTPNDNKKNPFSQVNTEEKELFYAKKGDSDNIYLISKEDKDALDKTIQELQQ